MAWLKLIRWPNLLILLATQFFVWLCLIIPAAPTPRPSTTLTFPYFFLLCLSTLLIAAAGYVINDYFDMDIDRINRPKTMVLGSQIPPQNALWLYLILNSIALILAFVSALHAGTVLLVLIQGGCMTLLWWYSKRLKRTFFYGNLIVALLTAISILVLFCYAPNIHPLLKEPLVVPQNPFGKVTANPAWILIGYAYFAFMLTWIREVIKDLEDREGDQQNGCDTMAIRWGEKRSVRFIRIIALLTLLPLLTTSTALLKNAQWAFAVFLLAGISTPLMLVIVGLRTPKTKMHYTQTSRFVKMIMALGIISLIIYYFETHA